MRNYIDDDRLLFILDELEKHFGYPVHAKAAAPNSWAVQAIFEGDDDENDYKWIFLTGGRFATPETLCHELLHLVFDIEGWPILYSRIDLRENLYVKELMKIVGSLPQHIAIWTRQCELGFERQIAVNYSVQCANMCRMAINRTMVQGLSEQDSMRLRSAQIAHLLLLPQQDTITDILLQHTETHWPDLLPIANEIVEIFNRHMPMTPISGVAATSECCTLLGVPDGAFVAHPVEAKEVGFYNRLREALTHRA